MTSGFLQSLVDFKNFNRISRVNSVTSDTRNILSQGEAFTLASISYLAILVKYILAKKKISKSWSTSKSFNSISRANIVTSGTRITQYKLADRHGAPRPPMTDVGTETAFRLEKAQAFPKK